ncbi:hypothetical protein NKH93_24860 [Mesorhizobium sp. M0954]
MVAWYRAFQDVEDRVKVATLDEIKKEGWTLNISRYVLPPIGQDIPPLSEAVCRHPAARPHRCQRLQAVHFPADVLQTSVGRLGRGVPAGAR